MGFVYNLLLFPTGKNVENRLGFDKVITISWVVHFFGRQCITTLKGHAIQAHIHYALRMLNSENSAPCLTPENQRLTRLLNGENQLLLNRSPQV